MIVALLTDFGTRDHYVGAMKGAVLSVCPAATLVDLTHDIAPQDILAGALELAAACRFFPAGTVFVAVVDPGVGSGRRAIAADAGGYRFVGPDNGLLSVALQSLAPAQVVALQEPKFARPVISRTFEGRDRFAPAAGWLARGTDLLAFGPPLGDPVTLAVPIANVGANGIEGEVLRIDRFGNLITNITGDALDRLGATHAVLQVGGQRAALVGTYAEAPPNALCALIGSSGLVEMAVNGGSAAARLQVGRGARVLVVRPPEP